MGFVDVKSAPRRFALGDRGAGAQIDRLVANVRRDLLGRDRDNVALGVLEPCGLKQGAPRANLGPTTKKRTALALRHSAPDAELDLVVE